MQQQDRFLVPFLIAVGLLVVGSVSLFFVRQGLQDYRADDSPEGVVHNYVLALQKRDYERAYSYLAEKEGKPDFTSFLERFVGKRAALSEVGLQIEGTEIVEDQAYVDVVVIRGGEPFSEPWRDSEVVFLERSGDTWKIVDMPYPYWSWNWYQRDSGD